MQEFITSSSILDVVSAVARHDIALVLPTLDHALAWWPVVRTAMRERHDHTGCVATTKTAVVTRCNHRALRLWVPYEEDPTMPMDFPHKFKYLCDYISPYYTRRELRRIATARAVYERTR